MSAGRENGYLTTLAAVYLAAPEHSDEEEHLEAALRDAASRLYQWGDDEVAEFVSGITRQHVEALQGFARPQERVRRSHRPRAMAWAALALLGALAGSAGAGDVTVQEAYPGSRLRPGSDANPYELRQDGRTLGRLEEGSPPTRWLVPGTDSNPYRVRPRRDAMDDGFDGFGALGDERDE